MIIYICLVVLIGLIFGSFSTAFSYRFPRGINFIKGRSFCDKCKTQISWYDNLPLLSFILLGGRCRACHKKISFRYPLIELAVASSFLLIFLVATGCGINSSPVCLWKDSLGLLFYPFIFFIFLLTELIFIIDLEKRIIPDELVFIAIALTAFALIFINGSQFYLRLLTAMVSAFGLLLIHLATRGRGMGLGDVKFALLPGLFLGWPLALVWLFVAFLTGAIVAIILILLGRAKGKDKIAFGPFLAISFYLVTLYGNTFLKWIIP